MRTTKNYILLKYKPYTFYTHDGPTDLFAILFDINKMKIQKIYNTQCIDDKFYLYKNEILSIITKNNSTHYLNLINVHNNFQYTISLDFHNCKLNTKFNFRKCRIIIDKDCILLNNGINEILRIKTLSNLLDF